MKEYIDYLKYLDFFTIKFNFYTNNQPTYQNVFGGIMSILYILICIGIFFGLCLEDIKRLNPIASTSVISDSPSKIISIKDAKIWIPFRIVTHINKYIDHRGKLFITPYLVQGKYNHEFGMDLKYHSLNYKLCNETSMAYKPDNYKIDIPLSELFCIEQNDIPFGWNENEHYLNYLEINLYLCEDGIYYNSSDSKCEKISDLLNSINTSLSFDFYYPVVEFQPNNFKNPLSVIYRNFYYQLSAHSQRIAKLYIKEHILSDDINILIKKYKNNSCWGISSILGDDYYLSQNFDLMNKNNTSNIYTMKIFMDYGFVHYTRTYNKLLVILSKIFPIFNFVLIFIRKFTQHVKMSITKRKLAGLIFQKRNMSEFSLIQFGSLKDSIRKSQMKIESKISKIDDSNNDILLLKNMNNESSSELKNNKMNIIKEVEVNKQNEKQELEVDKNSKNNSNNKSNLKLNDNKQSEINLKNISLIKEQKPPSVNNNSCPKKLCVKNRKRKRNEIFPFYYFFLDLFFDKLINPQKFCFIPKAYFTVYNFMCQIYDISTHIILFKQFNLLNNAVKKIYEERGYCYIYPFQKININDPNVIEKLNYDLKNKKSILFSKNLF